MNKIDSEITESVRCWVKHALGPQKKPVDSKITGQWNDRISETGTHTLISDLFIHKHLMTDPSEGRVKTKLAVSRGNDHNCYTSQLKNGTNCENVIFLDAG